MQRNINKYELILIASIIFITIIIQSCGTESVSPSISPYDTNKTPQIDSLIITPNTPVEPERTVLISDTFEAYCSAEDPEGDSLIYSWWFKGGMLISETNLAWTQWIATDSAGMYRIGVDVYEDWVDEEHRDNRSSIVDTIWVADPSDPIDTVDLYFSDFSNDDVTGNWVYYDSLAGLSNYLPDTVSITWDADNETMVVVAESDMGTYGFRMTDSVFTEGTFRIKVKAPNNSFGRVAFVPKFIDAHNYFLIGIDYFLGEWHIIYCIDGETHWPKLEWLMFQPNVSYEIVFQYSDGMYRVTIGENTPWEGEMPELFEPAANIGVAVYALTGAGPVQFDDLHITNP